MRKGRDSPRLLIQSDESQRFHDHFVMRKARQAVKNRAFRETSNFYLVKLNFNFIMRPYPKNKNCPLLKSENLINYC